MANLTEKRKGIKDKYDAVFDVDNERIEKLKNEIRETKEKGSSDMKRIENNIIQMDEK